MCVFVVVDERRMSQKEPGWPAGQRFTAVLVWSAHGEVFGGKGNWQGKVWVEGGKRGEEGRIQNTSPLPFM